MGILSFLDERDWTGTLAMTWIIGFIAMCAYAVTSSHIVMLEKVVALLGAPTIIVLKYYFDRVDKE